MTIIHPTLLPLFTANPILMRKYNQSDNFAITVPSGPLFSLFFTKFMDVPTPPYNSVIVWFDWYPEYNNYGLAITESGRLSTLVHYYCTSCRLIDFDLIAKSLRPITKVDL